MMPPISRSPNDPAAPGGDGTAMPPSRVSRGVPAAPLRSAPRADPADTSTLDMLGTNPMSDPTSAGLGNATTGAAGLALASMSSMAKGAQGLNAFSPGFVPAEVLMWLDAAMQQLPQLIQQQQQSALTAPTTAGPMQPPVAAFGPSTQPMAPAPSGGVGGMQMMR